MNDAKALYKSVLVKWPDNRQMMVNAKKFFESIADKDEAAATTERLKDFDAEVLPP